MKTVFTRKEFDLYLDAYLDTINEDNITDIIPKRLYDENYPLEDYKQAIKQIVKERYNDDLISLTIN